MEDKKKTHTCGPWRWELNENTRSISLCGGKPMFDATVMDFARYGMGGAAPVFHNGFSLERADFFAKIVEGREHHKKWFKTIEHPDAKLIAAAPLLLEALEEVIKELRFHNWQNTTACMKAEEAIKKATE